MYKKIMRFGRGHVRIGVTGKNLELFLNEALKKGVVFFDTKRRDKILYGGIKGRDFAKIRSAAHLAKVDVRVLNKSGLPFLVLRWNRRRGLLAGGMLIVLSVLVLSQFVLSVSVDGNQKVDTNRILAEADKAGIRPWVYRGVLDKQKLEKQLTEALAECTWVSVEERGTDILIHVVEKALPPQVVFQGDLVASKAGRVEEIMVIQGMAQVKEGDTVRQGQVLIEAEANAKVELLDPGVSSEHTQSSDVTVAALPVAKGFVRGRTWYSVEATLSLQETVIAETGSEKNGWGIKAGERVIMITQAESPYQESFEEKSQYRPLTWRNWQFPVEIIKVNYKQTQVEHISRTEEQALSIAQEQARIELMASIPQEAQILRQDSVIMPADEGFVRIRVQAEVFENLAVYAQ